MSGQSLSNSRPFTDSKSGMRTKTMELSGWGRCPRKSCRVHRPENVRAIQFADSSPVIARGQGRSYGDAAIPGRDGCAINTERLNRYLAFDESTGILRAEAGTTLAEVLETFIPRGWCPPVIPGTKFVSLGGCAAADVHGKNHHHVGSFGAHLTELEVSLADESMVRCSPTHEADLFHASVGGMGLTGIVTEVSLRLRRIDTALMTVRSQATRDLDQTLQVLRDSSAEEEYVASWIDAAQSAALGRGFVMSARHAQRDELAEKVADALRFNSPSLRRLPFSPPAAILRRWTAETFNRAYAWRQARTANPSIDSFESFFFPLDAISNWNRFYGSRGFAQYQCVVPPPNAATALRLLLETLKASSIPCFLAVLKRLGRQGAGLLSFPLEGYTLSLDFPMVERDLCDLFRKFDDIVFRQAGRVYLAKDACLDAVTFRAMYSRYPEWQTIKNRVDPANKFRSHLSERLGIPSQDGSR